MRCANECGQWVGDLLCYLIIKYYTSPVTVFLCKLELSLLSVKYYFVEYFMLLGVITNHQLQGASF